MLQIAASYEETTGWKIPIDLGSGGKGKPLCSQLVQNLFKDSDFANLTF